MNKIQKILLNGYFRNFFLLIDYSRFVVERAQYSRLWRRVFAVVYYTVIRNFYHGRILSQDEAAWLLARHDTVVRTPCICARATDETARGNCYYLGEAAELYRQSGPLLAEEVRKDDLLDTLRRTQRTRDVHSMTVGQRARCFFFPSEYVICLCDHTVCLPWHYQRSFPRYEIVTGHRYRMHSAAAHAVFILGLPALFFSHVYYLYEKGPLKRKILILSSILSIVSVGAGLLISRPAMFPYLHNPKWEYNPWWWCLLPLGLGIEVAAFYLLGRLILGKRKTKSEWLYRVLRGFLYFESIHLVRFSVVYVLSGHLEFSIVRGIFWAFDPLAWGALFYVLFKGVTSRPKSGAATLETL